MHKFPTCISALALLYSGSAIAQTTSTSPSDESASSSDEIVVQARRKDESLQDVPLTINVVTGETTQRLAIKSFEEIASVVPGLSLSGGAAGSSTGAFPAPALRGFTNDFLASGSSSVDFYINEALFEPRSALATIYDVGSFQVLQGPQGTTRGRSAPTGAILIATNKPSTKEFGGYASGILATQGEGSIQGAINAPIIKDVLAIRAAGSYNSSRGNFVRSINSAVNPERKEKSTRLSVLFTPSDNFDAFGTWQHDNQDLVQFSMLEGTGAPGGVTALAPKGYNGGTITAAQRLGVSEVPALIGSYFDLFTAQVNFRFAKHQLSYNFGQQNYHRRSNNTDDTGNQLIGNGSIFVSNEDGRVTTHEVRLTSDFGKNSLIDYTLGYFRYRQASVSVSTLPASFLSGAFNTPPNVVTSGFPPNMTVTNPDPRVFNTAYILYGAYTGAVPRQEDSIYASVTIRPEPKTEITLGGRKLWYEQTGGYNFTSTQPARALALQDFLVGGPGNCGFAPTPFGPAVKSLFTGYCDAVIPAGIPLSVLPAPAKSSPFIYNASISHRFSDSLLAYATVASSFRSGSINIGVNNGNGVAQLNNLVQSVPEKSRSYEIGFKTDLLDKRLKLNIAAYYQTYDGLLIQVPGITYRSVTAPCATADPTCGSVAVFGFNTNADAVSKGFSIDAAFQATREWSLNLGINYAKTNIDNDTVPCRDGNFDGKPDLLTPTVAQFIANNTYVASCKTNEVVTKEPFWNVVLQTQYERPIGSVNGYFRGLMNYNSSTSRRTPGFTAKSFALVNLYAGVRDPDGAWDIGVFARNAFNTGVQLSRDLNDVSQGKSPSDVFGLSGYRGVSYTNPRQFGIQARFSFGSR